MRRLRILIVDDNPAFLRHFLTIGRKFFEITTAASSAEALSKLAAEWPDAVLLDVDLGEPTTGIDLVQRIRGMNRGIPIVMISSDESIATVIAAMKAGANDYIPKHPNMEALHIKIHQVLEQVGWQEYALRLGSTTASSLVGSSQPMNELRRTIAQVAATGARVLITGESGSGKGMVARAIHEASRRREEKFASLNAASLPDTMFESEIIGFERGSFTGADRQRRGWLELASRGTFFLDEVDKLPLERQAKLLHIVEDGVVTRLGGRDPIEIDVRWLTASNRDLRSLIEAGQFREDFYFRIAEIEIFVPALRDRRSDIPELVRALLARESLLERHDNVDVDEEAMGLFQGHDWPGNVRELANILKRALIFSEDDHRITASGARRAIESIQRRLSPPGVSGTANCVPPAKPDLANYMSGSYREGLKALRAAYSRDFILRELERAGGNKTRAAERLGLKREHLYVLMKELGILG
jgi:DNA-binding NtrC family response regulator